MRSEQEMLDLILDIARRDERVRAVTELLGGMRVVKLFAWVGPSLDRVQVLDCQKKSQRRILLLRGRYSRLNLYAC